MSAPVWVVGFLVLHFTALGLCKWRRSDNIFGGYVTAFLLWFFGGGAVLRIIEYLTGASLL